MVKDQDGFTLVELMVVLALGAVLVGLSASALRNYWFTQALEGSTAQVMSQMRQVQQRTDSESAPLVYGVRFEVGTPNWAVVRYDPKSATTPDDDECTQIAAHQFSDGVSISGATFDAPPGAVVLSKCPQSSQVFAMFFARGTATQGTVTLRHELTERIRTISVLPLTGRVRVS
jgi:prepilin-type N-terminal cleavage/methylation domain-containing protein